MKNNPKKDLILHAGSECFARYGFDKTTLDDIGRRAGLNKASLYYYFNNKEEIFAAVFLSDAQAFVADLKTKTQAFPDVRRQIRFYLTERIRRAPEVQHLTSLPQDAPVLAQALETAQQEIKVLELAFLIDLLKRGVGANVFSFSEPSASIGECLFDLSDALKHETIFKGRRLQSRDQDFSKAVERMEHVLKLILKS